MRFVRIALAGAAALAAASVSLVVAAPAAHALPPGSPAVGWQYSSEANAYWRSPKATEAPGSDGPLLSFVHWSGTYEVTCPDGDPAYACDRGVSYQWCNPEIPGDRGLPRFAYITYERTPDPETGEMGPWIGSIPGSGCEEPGPDDVVEMNEIHEFAEARVLEELPVPDVALNPAPTGLVNLPVIVSTDYPRPMTSPTLSIDNEGVATIPVTIIRNRQPNFTGQITAWVDDYRWTFMDGDTAVGTVSGRGKGNPYTASIDPRTNPGYYVSHTYRTAGGGKSVTLNLTWIGRVQVPAVTVDELIDPVPVTMTTPEFGVVEAKPVLGNR